MLNEKEIKVYETIKKFIEVHRYSPSIRELNNILNYKSTKTIYRYLKNLKEKGYLNYQEHKKRSISINDTIKKNIVVMNTKKILNINFNEDIVIFQIKNNYFQNLAIKKNDYLIINIKSKIKDGDIGLFIINNDYRVMRYTYYDGFHILEDNEKEYLYKINLIGKVVGIYREKI